MKEKCVGGSESGFKQQSKEEGKEGGGLSLFMMRPSAGGENCTSRLVLAKKGSRKKSPCIKSFFIIIFCLSILISVVLYELSVLCAKSFCNLKKTSWRISTFWPAATFFSPLIISHRRFSLFCLLLLLSSVVKKSLRKFWDRGGKRDVCLSALQGGCLSVWCQHTTKKKVDFP